MGPVGKKEEVNGKQRVSHHTHTHYCHMQRNHHNNKRETETERGEEEREREREREGERGACNTHDLKMEQKEIRGKK